MSRPVLWTTDRLKLVRDHGHVYAARVVSRETGKEISPNAARCALKEKSHLLDAPSAEPPLQQEARALRCGLAANAEPPARGSVSEAPTWEPPEPKPTSEEDDPDAGKERCIAMVGDLHAPEHDRPAWEAFLRWCAAIRPDEVILTEVAEWQSVSMHGGSAWGHVFETDKAAGRRVLVQLRSVLPQARMTMLEANHDTRLTRWLEERAPQLVGEVDVPRALDLDRLGIAWVDERTVLRRGRLKMIHGHQLASNERSGMLPKYHAARAIQLYGEPGHTVVYWHTHRGQRIEEGCSGGMKRAVNLPCMRTLAPGWLRSRGQIAGWRHGFGVAYVGRDGQTSLQEVDIERGSLVWAGQRFSAAA